MQFLVKILKPVVAPVAFYNADAVMNMKTSWPTFHSPDVEIHLHPTCYNYILRKHCSFFFLFFCVFFLFFFWSISCKECSGWCSHFLPRRFKVWISVGFPALAWVFSWVWTCPSVRMYEHMARAPCTGSKNCVWFFCRGDHFPWLTNSCYFKSLKNNIIEVKSWGQQPRNE